MLPAALWTLAALNAHCWHAPACERAAQQIFADELAAIHARIAPHVAAIEAAIAKAARRK